MPRQQVTVAEEQHVQDVALKLLPLGTVSGHVLDEDGDPIVGAQIGVLSQSDQPLPIAPLLHRQVRVQGVYVGSRAHFEAMNRAIVANRMQPVVGRIFAFDQVRDALITLEGGHHFAKIVIHVVARWDIVSIWLSGYLIEFVGLQKGQ